MERFSESESPEDTPITSALSLIPTHFASREEVMAFLENPLFREPPEEVQRFRADGKVLIERPEFEFIRSTPSMTFDNIDLFYFKMTGLSIIGYGEIRDEPRKFCVVKFINPYSLDGGIFFDKELAERITRFRREISFLSRHQNDPFWVRVQKTGEGSYPFPPSMRRCPYVILEFCPGVDGDDFCMAPAFRKASAEPAFLATFALASLRIFADAAEEGRVLRDFKPSNVMITPRGFVFIDPGSITEIDSGLTPTGFVNGTPAFISPEQACGKPLDFRSDLYSLGVCLFYFATKRFPFTGRNGMEMMRKQLTEPIPVAALNHLPLGLRSLIFMLLAKDPGCRFQSLEEAAIFFRPFVQGTEMEAFLPPTLVRAPSFMPMSLYE